MGRGGSFATVERKDAGRRGDGQWMSPVDAASRRSSSGSYELILLVTNGDLCEHLLTTGVRPLRMVHREGQSKAESEEMGLMDRWTPEMHRTDGPCAAAAKAGRAGGDRKAAEAAPAQPNPFPRAFLVFRPFDVRAVDWMVATGRETPDARARLDRSTAPPSPPSRMFCCCVGPAVDSVRGGYSYTSRGAHDGSCHVGGVVVACL